MRILVRCGSSVVAPEIDDASSFLDVVIHRLNDQWLVVALLGLEQVVFVLGLEAIQIVL